MELFTEAINYSNISKTNPNCDFYKINLPLDFFFMFLLISDFLFELAPIIGINEEVGLIPLDDQRIDLFFGLFGHWVIKAILT